MNSFIIKGDICYSTSDRRIQSHEGAYLIVEGGLCRGVFDTIPEQFDGLEVRDYSSKLVIPGLVDLHLHAPQFAVRALGMDMELLPWLQGHAFPQEARYESLEYAALAYGIFADAMRKSATTRAVVFATVHSEASALLAQKLEETGIRAYVGKVNMDRDCPEALRETSSISETRKFIELCSTLKNVRPIITPRFIPSCTDSLLDELGGLAKELDLPVQSHLSENLGEIELVSQLCPESESYGHAYDRHGLFGQTKTVMAHCVYSQDSELELIANRGVFIAHCPQSNINVASGIAPVRKYLDMGLRMGLGSDVAGGSTEDMMRAVVDTVMVSKLRWRLEDSSLKPLGFDDAFYLATAGGGEFFGNVGSFENGFEADLLVLSDDEYPSPMRFSPRERLERLFYLGTRSCINAKYVCGEEIELS